tara:strand:+ start:840 stop:1133 length:294 start_codon:yes stop_codon:yes gene_type:complete
VIKLKKIYFDGEGFAKNLTNRDNLKEDEINLIKSFKFIPVNTISFKSIAGESFCDITIGDYYFKDISLEYLYTDIQKKCSNILYSLHNPTPNPGGLY